MIRYIIILCAFVVTFSTTQAQTCPPAGACSTWTSHVDTMSISKWGDIVAIVHYRIQNCSGTIRFIIDSSFAIDNGNHLDTFSLFHYDINSFKNLLELTLMQKVGKMVGVTIPPCNSGTTATNIQFYTAACGV